MWLAVTVVVATPLLSFVAVLVGHAVTRRGDVERDVWRHREETMRTLRWAVEVSTSADPVRAEAGLATLEALLEAELLQPQDEPMVTSVAEVVLSATAAVARGVAGGRPLSARPRAQQDGPPGTGSTERPLSVSHRQVRAARIAVKASAALGREPEPVLVEVAEAQP